MPLLLFNYHGESELLGRKLMTILSPRHESGSRGNQARTKLVSSPKIRNGNIISNPASPQEPKASNWSYLMLLLPVLCCGGPFLVLALGSIGVATFGVVGGLVVALAAVVGIFVVRRRKMANGCSVPGSKRC